MKIFAMVLMYKKRKNMFKSFLRTHQLSKNILLILLLSLVQEFFIKRKKVFFFFQNFI